MNNLQHIRLDELETMSKGDPRFVIRMLQVCADNTPSLLEKLKLAVQANDTPAMTTTAHRLRPTFHYLGRNDIADVLETLETMNATMAAADLVEKCDQVVQQAEYVLQDVNNALDQLKKSP